MYNTHISQIYSTYIYIIIYIMLYMGICINTATAFFGTSYRCFHGFPVESPMIREKIKMVGTTATKKAIYITLCLPSIIAI